MVNQSATDSWNAKGDSPQKDAAFSIEQAIDSGLVARTTGRGEREQVYQAQGSAARKFLHKNSLCGAEDTEWMATYTTGRSLRIAFFSGEKPPVFTLSAISDSTDLCGVFEPGVARVQCERCAREHLTRAAASTRFSTFGRGTVSVSLTR